MNQASWLSRAARIAPEKPAIMQGGRVAATYRQLARRSAGLATMLLTSGPKRGDRIAIVSQNSPFYLEAMYAIWHAGMIAVPINAKLHAVEIAWILEDCTAAGAFLDSDHFTSNPQPRNAQFFAALEFDSADYRKAAALDPAESAEIETGGVAWIFYTSGTTGRPKGAMLTHRNLETMSWAYLAEIDPARPGDILLHGAPMSHGSGLYALPHVARCAVNVVCESGHFDAGEIAELTGKLERISMFAAPTMIRRLVETKVEIRTDRLRTIVWGGAPMHVEDTIRALDRLGPCLAQIYGQAESPMTISSLSKAEVANRDDPGWRTKIESAGVPSAAVEITIADEPGKRNETGEILVRGDTVMAGYWNQPDASAETLQGGWLHTGDIGAFDEQGYLHLKDRSKDVIISGGSNIYPREVEEVLLRHPLVHEVAVVGKPDREWGETVVAFVVGNANAEELDHLCVENIARFKRPKAYRFIAELPKNNYGKIEKAKLKAVLAQS